MKADFEKGTKICSCCREELPLSSFFKVKSNSDGFCSYCKQCKENKNKGFSISDKGRLISQRYNNSEKHKVCQKAYASSEKGKATLKRHRHSERYLSYQKEYHSDGRKLISDRKYRCLHKEELSAYRRKRFQADCYLRAVESLRRRVNLMFSQRSESKKVHSVSLLGCSVEFFKSYIEQQFTEGMTWENYGSYWHLDHIVPCVYFQKNRLDLKICFNYMNYQPLEAKQNISKGDKLPKDYLEIIERIRINLK